MEERQGLRRSGRPNLGQPPDRYGYQRGSGLRQEQNVVISDENEDQSSRRNLDRVFEEMATSGRRQYSSGITQASFMGLSGISEPQLYSTPRAESVNLGMEQVSPSNFNSFLGVDDQLEKPESLWETTVAREEDGEEDISCLEERVLLKAENLSLRRTLQMMQQEDRRQSPVDLTQYENYDSSSEDDDTDGSCDTVISKGNWNDVTTEIAISPGDSGMHYRPTPIQKSMWKPTHVDVAQVQNVKPAVVPPKPRPRTVFPFGGQNYNPLMDKGFVPISKPRSKLRQRSSPVPTTVSRGISQSSEAIQAPAQGVDALASAIIQALRNQNQQTEKFVARQSSASALPAFSGNPLDWPLFAHHFRQSTEDCGFSAAQNMARLEKALRGEARKAVRALMIIPDNAYAVMDTLEQRYGRPEYVIQALADIAKKTPTPKENNLSTLVDFSIAVKNLVVTIQTLGEKYYLRNPQLLQELVGKLPDQLKLQWGMQALGLRRSPNLRDFSVWMERAAMAVSMVTIPKMSLKEKRDENTFVVDSDSSPEPVKYDRIGTPPPEENTVKPCWACGKGAHGINSCETFQKMSKDERYALVRKFKRCFCCLKGGHAISNCKSRNICRVDGCNKRHHTMLHTDPQADPVKMDKMKEKEETVEINPSYSTYGSSGILQIVVVRLSGPKGEMVVNALLDGASSVTLMCAKLADRLGLDGATDPLRIKWTDESVQEYTGSKKVDVWIEPLDEKAKYKVRSVRTVDNLKLSPQRKDLREIVESYPHLRKQKIYFKPGERPLILIGQQHAHLITTREVLEKDDRSPMLSRTKLGWVVHGPRNGNGESESVNVCSHESDDDILHNLVKESFTLESIGIKTCVSSRSSEDTAAEELMEKVTTRVGDRWQTGLLWRDESTKLPDSRDVAERRLLSIERKLKRDESLAQQYRERIAHYLESGYARKLTEEELLLPTNIEWYLPHFDRQHPNKPKGKIRLIFDAASKSKGVSLNDHLLTGPDLLVSLVGVLLKFRQRKIAVSGDIAEMFHQVRIRPEDCSAQRFLWRESETAAPSTFQLEVMMFGSACSPYCAQWVKNRNAMEFRDEYPDAVKAIVKRHYMDDYLDSFDSEKEATQLTREVTQVHKRGGFDIGKWMSNSNAVLEDLGGKLDGSTKSFREWSDVPTERALGLHWVPDADKFTFRVNLQRAGNGIATGEVIPTKRAVLRLVMLIWDPLGFLGHLTIKARILLQDLWKTKLGWDDQLTEKQFKKWKKWIQNLPLLAQVRISRCYSSYTSSSQDVTLHIFADSSEAASCSVAYLRVVEDQGVRVSMVMSKTRVAPLKPCSVPRLELTAAVMAARLGKFIQSELDVTIHGVTYWTDSMTVLRWIRSEARKYQQFVANRVGEIQECTEVGQWRWVPSEDNPADDGTREGKVDLQENSRWWTGPAFLRNAQEEFPGEHRRSEYCTEEENELRKEFQVAVIEDEDNLLDVGRFSSYLRLLRTTSCVLRFVQKLKKIEMPRLLSLKKAETFLVRQSQQNVYSKELKMLEQGKQVLTNSSLFKLSPILDKNGVMVMDSRLATSSKTGLRLPIILHPKERLTVLLLEYYHRLFGHAGEDVVRNEVRQRFWIPRLRSTTRMIIRSCIACRKRKTKVQIPMMAALPDIRIQPQPRAFYISGMDYFGPMEVTIGRRREKRYGVLFTCMNTRAVHLELAASLSTDSCIMAIRRMIARRGQISELFSDNGTNLRGADKELRQALLEIDQDRMTMEMETKQINWHFIPPSAAHMGGSWERLVRSVKVSLSVILKCRAPREEVLQTLLAEAEAIVNSRPLVEVPVDPESPEALTPFHFLIGSSSTQPPPGNFDVKRVDLVKQWRQSQVLADHFWKRWVKEYLPTLQRRAKWHQHRPSVSKGDVVIVVDESLKRGSWPLGLVQETFPGQDGIVRVAMVRTESGTYKRPVVKLAKLDVKAVGTDI